jgi:Uma2 family endonuclease
MSSVAIEHRYTAEEYLALERKAEYKNEYVNGHIIAMSGASRQHNIIAANISREISTQLRGRPCESYINDMRVRVSETGLYTYPDVVAVCGDIRFADEQTDTLLNPTVIVEVLSSSTEAYDRGDKFAHYRRLESLQDYLLVSQETVRVEHYVRQGEKWLLSEASALTDTVHLASIQCDLVLGDIYDKVQFHNTDDTP